jgi:hypothetical protein
VLPTRRYDGAAISAPNSYLVVVRAISAAQLAFNDPLVAQLPDAHCVIKSEHVGGEDGWPLALRGEASGTADDIECAQRRLSEAVSGLLPLVALAANAAHADPSLVVAHGTTPSESAPAEWIAYEWPAPSTHFPPQSRTVPTNLVGALLEAADRYPSAGYHGRAVGLYREALKYWTPESTLLAAEYLWMATEALSRGIVEAEAAERNMTPGNLAKLRKVAGPPTLYRLARERVVFSEDAEALDALGKASEGFEHGYMPIADIRALAEPILERAACRVRHALISVLDMPEVDAAALLATDFDEPRGLVPPIRILRGKLQVNDPSLAPTEVEDAVEVEWESPGERLVERDAAGNFTITGTTKVTMRNLPKGLGLTAISSGMRVQGATAYAVGETVVRRVDSS